MNSQIFTITVRKIAHTNKTENVKAIGNKLQEKEEKNVENTLYYASRPVLFKSSIRPGAVVLANTFLSLESLLPILGKK